MCVMPYSMWLVPLYVDGALIYILSFTVLRAENQHESAAGVSLNL